MDKDDMLEILLRFAADHVEDTKDCLANEKAEQLEKEFLLDFLQEAAALMPEKKELCQEDAEDAVNQTLQKRLHF